MNSAHSGVLQSAWFSFTRPTLARSEPLPKGSTLPGCVGKRTIYSGDDDWTFPMPVGTRFEWHMHADHQIAWSPEGVLVVIIEGGGTFVLPPSRALWIAAGTVHETRASGAAVLRSVYLEPRRCPIDWTAPTPVAVYPTPRRSSSTTSTTAASARRSAPGRGCALRPAPTASDRDDRRPTADRSSRP